MNTQCKWFQWARAFTPVAMLLILAACGDGERRLESKLLIASEPSDPELQRLRLAQRVQLQGDKGTVREVDIGDNWPESSSDGYKLVNAVYAACVNEDYCPSSTSDKCEQCFNSVNLCMATAFEQMATGDSAITLPITFEGATDSNWTVPPQPTSTRVSLLRRAYRQFASTADYIVLNLSGTWTSSCSIDDLKASNGNLAATLGAFLVQAQQGVLSSSHEFAKASAAAADAQRRQGPSLEVDADKSIAGVELSRVEAAHVLVGGPAGMQGVNRAICRHPPLDSSAKKALALLRDAGVAPADVLAMSEFQTYLNSQQHRVQGPDYWPTIPNRTVSIENLLHGKKADGEDSLVGPSVQRRLAVKLGYTPKDVPTEMGIGVEAFARARYALAEELMLYGKFDVDKRLPQVGLDDKSLWPFAATASAPDNIPRHIYGAILRTPYPNIHSDRYSNELDREWSSSFATLDDTGGGITEVERYNPRFNSPGGGRPDAYRELLTTARTLSGIRWFAVRAATGSASGSTSDRFTQLRSTEEIRTALSPYVSILLNDDTISGRLSMVLLDNNARSVQFYLDGFRMADSPTIVRGTAGLMCATTGNIWGAPCQMKDSKISEDFEFNSEFSTSLPVPGISIFNNTTMSSTVILPDHIERWYLVVPKDSNVTDPGPGSYKPLLGFVPNDFVVAQTAHDMQWWPISESLEASAAELIESQPDECSVPAVSCSGVRFDERLALEDELSSDGSDIESSWKTYLQRAKEAATTSDELGEAYIQSGISADQWTASQEEKEISRQEMALGQLDRLQAICGTHVGPEVLLNSLGDGSGAIDLNKLLQSSCTSSSNNVGTKCFVNFVAELRDSPNGGGKELADCLESFAKIVPIIALGDKQPCAWRDSAGTICGGATAQMPCPVYTEDASCDEMQKPSTATWLTGNDDRATLNLFSSSQYDSPNPGRDVCKRVRESRRDVKAHALSELSSEIFSLPTLGETRKRLGMMAELGSYVGITVDGTLKYATGTMRGGYEGENWPCGAGGRPSDCAEYNGGAADPSTFLCNYSSCGDLTNRANWNYRLLRAYVIAKATTWRPGQGDAYNQYPTVLPMMTGRYQYAQSEDYLSDMLPLWPRTTAYLNSRTNSNVSDGVLQGLDSYSYSDSGWGTRTVYAPAGGFNTDPPFSLGGVKFEYRLNKDTERDALFTMHESEYGPDHCGMNKERTSCSFPYDDDPYDDKTIASSTWRMMAPLDDDKLGFVANALTSEGSNAVHELQNEGFAFSFNASADPSYVIYQLEYESVLDAAELLCQVGATSVGEVGECSEIDTNSPQSIEDLGRLSAYLRCSARQIADRARRAAFLDFPKAALDPMQKHSTGTYVTEPGEIGQAYSDIRNAALQVELSAPIVSEALNNIGQELQNLKNQLAHYDIQNEMANVRFDAEAATALASCAGSMISAVASLGTQSGGAVAACGNLASVLYYGDKLRDLSEKETALEREIAVGNFRMAVNTQVASLQAEQVKVAQALETLRARLGKVESLKQEAMRSLQSAVWHLAAQSKTASDVTTVLGRHQALAQERYRRAHDNAVRLSFIAKRAIEQRLGMSLADITEDMPLVDAPARWESSICATSPIDFSALKAKDASVQAFADAFVGDYVTKLENVVESYRLKYSFHEGDDVVVASFRDDLIRAQAPCSIKSRNLLTNSSHLDQSTAVVDPSTDQNGWLLMNCRTHVTSDGDGGVTTRLLPDCESTTMEPTAAAGATFYSLSFADGGKCTGVNCGWQEAAILGQKVTLTPGKYAFSWYAVNGNLHNGKVQLADGTNVSTQIGEESQGGIPRWWLTFDVSRSGTYIVGFVRPHFAAESWVASVAAPMLERLDGAAPGGTVQPGVFEDADASGNAIAQICPDKDGSVFRATRWRRGCDALCKDGFEAKCATSDTQSCYWETSFHFRQKDIEDGTVFRQSGFARGNFNYRIQSLALNFVGTGLQACDGSSQACYGSGFVPYTIIHEGPYYVRNHLGEDFEAKLFTGRIEHARGLGAERYITNPISSTDLSLLESYMRPEFSGRPLDGTFIVRVWDENNVKFDAIKDVQLVMKYHYWTRFQ